MTQVNAAWQEPLNAEEILRATAIAISDHSPAPTSQSSSTTEFQPGEHRRTTQAEANVKASGLHPLGTQVLFIELKEQKNPSPGTDRLAEVFVFDYQRGVTELSLIDVEQNSLVTRQTLASVHLPLSDTEISYSKSLIWNNVEIKRQIENEIIATGQAASLDLVESLSELKTRVSIWVPDSPAQAGLSNCVSERCALISLFTVDNYNFSIEPVLNLMHGTIYTDLIQ